MSLNPLTYKTGATWTPSGGSDLSFAPDGRVVDNGLSLVCSGDTNLLTRRTMQLKASLPGLPATNGAFAKLARNTLTLKVPFIAADGKLYQQTITVGTAFHAEYNATTRNGHINDIAALVTDADILPFWQSLLLS